MAKKPAKLSMKEELLNLVNAMEADGFKFDETPALFKWLYPEKTDIAFELLIQKATPMDETTPIGSTQGLKEDEIPAVDPVIAQE